MPTGLEPSQLLIIAAAVAIPVVILVVVMSARSHRRTALRERFGAEYDRTLRTAPNKRTGLRDLEEREQLAQELALRDASTDEVSDLRRRIASLQYAFLDDPKDALLDLRHVVDDALAARDYPVREDRERALRLLSVEDPDATVALRRLDEVTDDRPRTSKEGPLTLDVQREVFLGVRAALRDVAGVPIGADEPPAALVAPTRAVEPPARAAEPEPRYEPEPAWRHEPARAWEPDDGGVDPPGGATRA